MASSPLLLPKLNVEIAIGKSALDESSLPAGTTRVVHFDSSITAYDDKVVSVPKVPAVPYFSASTYTGMRCMPCGMGAKTYQRLSCSTNAKK
jgi:hypothetical protein